MDDEPAEMVAGSPVEVSPGLHPVARYSVWAHLRKLADEGRAVSPEADDVEASWTAPPAGATNNRK